MKKTKAIILSGLFATTIGIATPIINSYSSYNVIKEIKGSESVEKGVDKIKNVPVSKEEQMEMFKNVSVDDVMEQFTNERSLMYATVYSINDSNFENKNVYDESSIDMWSATLKK